jgi:hypothetical protein
MIVGSGKKIKAPFLKRLFRTEPTDQVKVQVENQCSNPPLGLAWQVRRSLSWINQADLVGIEFICLMDEVPTSVKGEIEEGSTHGFYCFQTSSSRPYIILSIREIYRGVPSFLWWSSVPTLRISRTLAHEVAHHLVATKEHVSKQIETSEDEESFANEYAGKVLKKMTKRWYYKLGSWCIKDLSGWHYAFGLIDMREGNYRAAADHFFSAWDLNPEFEDAADWYWRAREMNQPRPKLQSDSIE